MIQKISTAISSARWAVIFSLYFLTAALTLIPYFGIQNDEALFGSGIYPPSGVIYSQAVRGRELPVMLISYLGTPKTWFYMAWFKRWGPSAYSLRLPVVLGGIGLIWLFRSLIRRAAGERAAVIGCALLATDTTFLLTNTFDWGPVALQHLTLTGGVVLLVRFHRNGSIGALAGGFFLFGLGLWDKALFLWTLGGVGVAGLVVYWTEIRRAFSPRNFAIALLAGSLGSLPLLVYNYDTDLATIRGNARLTTSKMAFKAHVLHITLNGSALFGWLSSEDPRLLGTVGKPLEPRTLLERGSVALGAASGKPRIGFLAFAVAAAVMLVPFLWNTPARRPMLFALIFLSVAWIQMAVTKDAGEGVHHTVLLWPFPHFLAAVVFDALATRIRRYGPWIAAAVVAIVCAQDALVTNNFIGETVRHRATTQWTDAIYPLSEDLKHRKPVHVFVMDWGILDSLRLLNRGRLPLHVGSDPLMTAQMTAEDRFAIRQWIASPENLFVGHTEGNEFFTGVSKRLVVAAAESGLRKDLLKTIADSTGRPMFELFRFVPAR